MDQFSILVYAVVFLVVVLVPELYDVYKSYEIRKQVIREFGTRILARLESERSAKKPGGNSPTEEVGGEPPDVLQDSLKLLLKDPEGIPGLGRQVMTVGVLAVIAIAMVQLLLSATALPFVPATVPANTASYNQTLTYVSQTTSTELEIVKSLVTILGGAVSAMIGFYFGAKGSSGEEAPSKEAGSSPQTGKPGDQGNKEGV